MPNEEFFRREEDRRRLQGFEEKLNGIESRIVSLTSSQKVTDDEMDELAGSMAGLDELLHGDRSQRDSGIVGQLNSIETKVNSVLAILHPDNTGHGGLLYEHGEIKRKVLGKERSREEQWKFWGLVIVAMISTVGYLIKSWPEISAYWETQANRKKQVDTMINRTKHPHRTVAVSRVRVVPKEDEEETP